MARPLLCIAEGRANDWEAICLDLDIAVQGGSFSEVQRLLEKAIETYIEDVAKEGKAARERLLLRRVPWSVRLKYAVQFFLFTLFSRKRADELHGYFEVSCPV